MYTTVGDLIRELKKYHPEAPIFGMPHNTLCNKASVTGNYPDPDDPERVDNVLITFWEDDVLTGNLVEPTGKAWTGGSAPPEIWDLDMKKVK